MFNGLVMETFILVEKKRKGKMRGAEGERLDVFF